MVWHGKYYMKRFTTLFFVFLYEKCSIITRLLLHSQTVLDFPEIFCNLHSFSLGIIIEF